MKTVRFVSVVMCSVLLLASCSNKGGKSATTGWNLNDPKWGGYERSAESEQPAAPGLVFIEGGSFVMGHVAEDDRYKWDNIAHTVTVSSFYMDECEVSNFAYGEFEYWMVRAYGEEFRELVEQIRPDTACWRDKLAWRESFVDHYYRSPSYADYPVVGVSWEQANKFCRWRTDRVNENILVDRGLIEMDQENVSGNIFQTDVYLAGLFESDGKKSMTNYDPAAAGEGRRVKLTDGILYPYYRLPTEAEWEFAALGMVGDTYDERVVEHKTYPWAGQALRSVNKKYYGQFLANFKRTRGDAMGVAGNLNDGWDYTCPVKWYFPNDYGLYNMAGNVSEWCMDVYRKIVNPQGADDIDPFRGNYYTSYVVQDDEVQLDDTGRVIYQEVEYDMNRRNYRQADNINYLDGDLNSNLNSGNWTNKQNLENARANGGNNQDGESNDSYADNSDDGYGYEVENEDENGSQQEDNRPELTGEDLNTNMMYQRRTPSSTDQVNTLINNKVRVVKGGNWNDRAYYLQSSTRRYYDQNRSTSWIGFRCAMDRLGSRTEK